MTQATVNIRMDESTKNQFEKFCSNIGMSMSTAINVFIKQSLKEQKIPFEIKADSDPFYSKANMDRLSKAIEQLENGNGTFHEVL